MPSRPPSWTHGYPWYGMGGWVEGNYRKLFWSTKDQDLCIFTSSIFPVFQGYSASHPSHALCMPKEYRGPWKQLKAITAHTSRKSFAVEAVLVNWPVFLCSVTCFRGNSPLLKSITSELRCASSPFRWNLQKGTRGPLHREPRSKRKTKPIFLCGFVLITRDLQENKLFYHRSVFG